MRDYESKEKCLHASTFSDETFYQVSGIHHYNSQPNISCASNQFSASELSPLNLSLSSQLTLTEILISKLLLYHFHHHRQQNSFIILPSITQKHTPCYEDKNESSLKRSERASLKKKMIVFFFDISFKKRLWERYFSESEQIFFRHIYPQRRRLYLGIREEQAQCDCVFS